MPSKILYIILLLLLPAVGKAKADDSEQRFATAVAMLRNAPSVTFKYYYEGDRTKIPGTLTIAREKYTLDAGNFRVWYNGSTMWAYAAKSKELSISNPTTEELMESNPFEIMSNYKTYYNLTGIATQGGAMKFTLKPKSRSSSVTQATVILGADDRPKRLAITFSSGQKVAIVITSVKEGKALPASAFVYDSKKYPASETVDLR